MLNSQTINNLQAQIREQIRNGAPGVQRAQGSCRPAPPRPSCAEDDVEDENTYEYEHTDHVGDPGPAPKGYRPSIGSGIPSPFAPELADPRQPTGVIYSVDRIKGLIINDLNGKGFDMGQVRIEFTPVGAVVTATGKPAPGCE